MFPKNLLKKKKNQKERKEKKRKNLLLTNTLLYAAAAKSLRSCPTLCDPRDGSPPGFPVPGILQARTLGGRVTTQTPINLGETDLIP